MALHEPDTIYQGYRIRIELLNYESVFLALIFGPINIIVKFVCHECFTVENTEEIEDMMFEVDDSSMEQENSEQYRKKRNAVSYLWPGGIIPYEIAPEFDGEYSYTLSIRLSVSNCACSSGEEDHTASNTSLGREHLHSFSP